VFCGRDRGSRCVCTCVCICTYLYLSVSFSCSLSLSFFVFLFPGDFVVFNPHCACPLRIYCDVTFADRLRDLVAVYYYVRCVRRCGLIERSVRCRLAGSSG